MFKNRLFFVAILFLLALAVKFGLVPFLAEDMPVWIKILSASIILAVGAGFVITGTAKIIEETTEVLHERTHLAGGLLQSFGTAFPDMVLGIVAAIVSLKLRDSNYELALNYALIAAATTFGSNIYNIGHAAWCLYRQNLANTTDKIVMMLPGLKAAGLVKPVNQHRLQPSRREFDTAIAASVALTILTACVAISMVIFGQVTNLPIPQSADLYQLIRPVGIGILILAMSILLYFRKSQRDNATTPEIEIEESYYRRKSNLTIWLSLIISGAAILFAAESMIYAIEILSHIFNIPVVIAGVLSGLIGCLGEMTVVHNYSVHPNGRLGDAVVGVAMDNIVTIVGASIVAIIGGIFLGGPALILIFVLILTLNAILIGQMSQLKNYLTK